MKFPPGQSLVPRRGATIRGVGIWKEHPTIGQVFQRHPKRQPSRTALEEQNRQTLAAASRIAQYVSAEMQQLSREISENSQLAARDFTMIMLFGRAFYIVNPDGSKVYSMASLQDTSQLIDVLSQYPNSLLVRGDNWWGPLLPGTPGQVVTIGVDGSPEWQSPAAAGSPPDSFLSPPPLRPDQSGNFNTGNFQSLGIVPAENQTLHGIRVMCKSPATGVSLVAGIYADNGSGGQSGGALVAESAPVTMTAGMITLPFTAALNVTAGHVYWFGLLANGGSGTPTFMLTDTPRNGLFFNQSGTSLPSTSPSTIATGAGNQFTWWAY